MLRWSVDPAPGTVVTDTTRERPPLGIAIHNVLHITGVDRERMETPEMSNARLKIKAYKVS